jgi:hypothetical protein
MMFSSSWVVENRSRTCCVPKPSESVRRAAAKKKPLGAIPAPRGFQNLFERCPIMSNVNGPHFNPLTPSVNRKNNLSIKSLPQAIDKPVDRKPDGDCRLTFAHQ